MRHGNSQAGAVASHHITHHIVSCARCRMRCSSCISESDRFISATAARQDQSKRAEHAQQGCQHGKTPGTRRTAIRANVNGARPHQRTHTRHTLFTAAAAAAATAPT